MEEVKFTDSQIHSLVRNMGLDGRERDILELTLQIYMRKYNALSENHVKDLLRHLEDARLISSSDYKRALDKIFEE